MPDLFLPLDKLPITLRSPPSISPFLRYEVEILGTINTSGVPVMVIYRVNGGVVKMLPLKEFRERFKNYTIKEKADA